METADIVVVGAGVVGLCSALALSRRMSGRIVVLDKGRGPGEGSTGASSAVCRARYSLDEMVALARDGVEAYRKWPEFLEVADPVGRLHEDGVLWLGDLGASARGEAARLRRLGVGAEAIDDEELSRRFPAINPCPIAPDLITGEAHDCEAGGLHLLETHGGHFDPAAALDDLLRALRTRSVDVRFGARVASVDAAHGRVEGVGLASGETIACGAVLNASGPWCNELLKGLGLGRWPLAPTRIQIALVDRPPAVGGRLPVCADLAAGIYFRDESAGRRIVVGSVSPTDEREFLADPEELDRSADADFVAAKLHALQHRVRGLDVIKGVQGYSGLYTMNRRDFHPIVGATSIEGFFVANGFSGHGFKLAPAIGESLADVVAGSGQAAATSRKIGFLAFDRVPLTTGTAGVLA